MRFVFQGTVAELKDAIRSRAKLLHRDILLEQDSPDILRIGFQRLGHNGGRYFVAAVNEENGCITLTGEAKDIYSNRPKNKFKAFLSDIGGWLTMYCILALIPFAVWLCFARSISSAWIPLLLTLLVMLCLRFLNRNQDSVADERFLRFMNAVVGEEITVPACSADLYGMLLKEGSLHSVPQLKEDVIQWNLYEKVRVEASVNEVACTVEILRDGFLELSLMHWHSDPEEILRELLDLGRKGNILVLRKTLLGTETFYIGPENDYPYAPRTKWHWGRLIYLKQKR